MLSVITAIVSGLLFGLGLTVSQMINPAKVIAFIDVFCDFDPSLAFVMPSAIPVSAIGYWLGGRRHSPICAPGFTLPTQRERSIGLSLRAQSCSASVGGWSATAPARRLLASRSAILALSCLF